MPDPVLKSTCEAKHSTIEHELARVCRTIDTIAVDVTAIRTTLTVQDKTEVSRAWSEWLWRRGLVGMGFVVLLLVVERWPAMMVFLEAIKK